MKKTFDISEISGSWDDVKDNNFVLPKQISDEMGLEPGDPLKVYLGDEGTVIIEKLEKSDKGESEKA